MMRKFFFYSLLMGLLCCRIECLFAEEHPSEPPSYSVVDILIINGRILDGGGNPWVQRDIGIKGDKIVFVGHSENHGIKAHETIDADGLWVTPGFWDVHGHAPLHSEEGKKALPLLYQGVTTVLLGVDGAGANNIAEQFAHYREQGIAINVARYVGHNAARRAVMGMDDREPTRGEMRAMKEYIEKGMEEGALGLSSGLFYTPGYYATTDEVVELNKVAARYGGIYDTHDRDLGATYQGIGYDASVKEAIEIGERAGTPVIFSHYNLQGVHNYGRAPVGAALVEEARARGVNVMAAQHVYTATQSSLAAYTLPRWAASGGEEKMRERFQDPDTVARLNRETMEMLEIRGGPEKIFFTDRREDLNGRTLAEIADEWGLSVPETVRKILEVGNVRVMNLDLYDKENTKYLARQEWMMTCTDGSWRGFGEGLIHPRPYGAFARKLRLFVFEDEVISFPFAVRGMTSLAATFFGFPDRGLIKEGFYADISIFNLEELRDNATYENPHQYSDGTVYVIVNGEVAFRDGVPTGVLAGRPLPRER